MKIDVEDLSHAIPISMMIVFPCCPLCDNEISQAENIKIINAHNSVCLAHSECITEFLRKYESSLDT